MLVAEFHVCRTAEDYFALVNGPTLTARWLYERHLATRHPGGDFGVPGVCTTCMQGVDFGATHDGAWTDPDGLQVPNWRECLWCPRCTMSGRQRLVVHRLTEELLELRRAPAPRVYLTEQLSPVFAWTRTTFPWVEVVGSEYLVQRLRPEVARATLRHEDLQALSFPDASFDRVVSCDVLEHVPDPACALAEIARVLRPGGRALLTFPMDPHLAASRRRARVVDGAVVHDLPAAHHGNPLSTEGALVFTDFGWDVLDVMRGAGLADPRLTVYWSATFGWLGIQFYFTAERPR